MKELLYKKFYFTPLHIAIIENNESFVELHKGSHWHSTRDDLGFTPSDLARLLDKKHICEILNGPINTKYKFQKKGSLTEGNVTTEELESHFNIHYRHFLTFRTYQELRYAVLHCPFLLSFQKLAKENYEGWSFYQKRLEEGFTAKISIRWINDILEYGAFLDEDLPAGALIGEYTGLVRRLYRHLPNQNPYCFQYPTRWWSLKRLVIDAQKYGNITRFINHSDSPNLNPLCLVDGNRLLHQVFITNKALSKGTHLTFDYGIDYWR